jgi:hypothetical protein
MRRPLPGVSAADDISERDVSWAVTVRSSAPMLGPLRGGELVLLPDRVLAESGLAVSVLLRELGTHNVGAAVVETPPSIASAVPVLITPDLSIDFETSLNRMLTERRGELYRAGTELGRMLGAGGISQDVSALIRTASEYVGCPIVLMDIRGNPIERSGNDPLPAGAGRTALSMTADREWRENRYLVKLASGDVLWFGPVARDNRALIRLASERVAMAVESVVQRTVDERPRGAARSTALNALLIGTPDGAARSGPMMGLASEGRYRVLLASPDADTAGMLRGAGQLGVAHEAGDLGINKAIVVQMRTDAPEPRRNTGRSGQRALGAALSGVPAGWIAISGEVGGSEGLPSATRQARYVAALIDGGLLPNGVHQFDRLPDIGIYRLLYDLWGSTALTAFVDDALGDLRKRDKRGTFRETLLAYLNAGGSHVETAAALGIHRNTLAYRLRQIGQLIGRDPDDPNMRLVMHLALVAAALPGALPSPGA